MYENIMSYKDKNGDKKTIIDPFKERFVCFNANFPVLRENDMFHILPVPRCKTPDTVIEDVMMGSS
jgi:hypothetical protein